MIQLSPRVERLCTHLLFFILFSRGLFELVIAKQYALFFQFSLSLSLVTLLFPPKRALFTPFLLLFLLALDVLLSAMLTSALHGTFDWIPYVLFTGGVLWLFFLLLCQKAPKRLPHLVKDLLIWGVILFTVALFEQLRWIKLPGESEVFVVRAASLTGSYLHYPLLIALIGFVALDRGWRIAAFLFLAAPFFVVSRSGVLIVTVGLLAFPLFAKGRGLLTLASIALIAILTAYATLELAPHSPGAVLIERVLTAGSQGATGNRLRIETWKRISKEWLQTNLLIGEDTGKVTNLSSFTTAAKKARWGRYNISESSPLELLSNFGLIGCLLYYALLSRLFLLIGKAPWIQAAALGALAQTLVYQSIEVIPFLFLLLLLPSLSYSYSKPSEALFPPNRQKNSFTLA